MITQLNLVSFHPLAFVPILQSLHCEVPAGTMSIDVDDTTQDSIALPIHGSHPAKRVLLPHLRTVGITPLDRDNIADICKLISTRQVAGRSISCIKTSSYDRVPLDRFQWLKENAMLEYY
jgi:hypothetical protein